MKKIFLLAMACTIATGALAEDAPVYDVDSYPPQFEGQPDIGPRPTQAAPSVPQQPYIAPTPLTADQRILRLEQQMNNLQQSSSADKVSALQAEVQTLRGQVEELNHQLQQMQTQQKTQYSDLDKRINTEAAPSTNTLENDDVVKPNKQKPLAAKSKSINADKPQTDVGDKNTVAQPNVAEEQQIYQTAYDLIKAKKYNDAIAALQKMIQKYPSGQFAANAHFWLGELYGLVGKNDEAATEFSNVVTNYPDSPKVADAQLKLGMIYAAQFKWPDAKTAFKKVINRYPGSASARLAKEQLKQIKAAGH